MISFWEGLERQFNQSWLPLRIMHTCLKAIVQTVLAVRSLLASSVSLCSISCRAFNCYGRKAESLVLNGFPNFKFWRKNFEWLRAILCKLALGLTLKNLMPVCRNPCFVAVLGSKNCPEYCKGKVKPWLFQMIITGWTQLHEVIWNGGDRPVK